MDNIFIVNDYKKQRLGAMQSISCHYCCACKKIFDYDLHYFFEARKNDGMKLIKCPHCGNEKKAKDIKHTNNEYLLYLNYHVNGDKLQVNNATITFKYYRKRIVTFITKNYLVINMKTGMSYMLPSKENGKIKSTIKNCTYSYYGWMSNDIYTEKCKKLKDILPAIYEEIRQYKMNNITDKYIPTYEQNINSYKEDSIFGFIDSEMDRNGLREIVLFNRFPFLSFKDNKEFFFAYYDMSKKQKRYIELRRALKQEENKVYDFILKRNGVPATKINKQNLHETGLEYAFNYKEFVDMIGPDNYHKLASTFKKSMFLTDNKLLSFFKTYDLTKQQKNNFCNKITRYAQEHRYSNYIIYDTIHTAVLIKQRNPDYNINLKLNIDELHDELSSDYNKLRNKNVIIDYSNIKVKDLYSYSRNGLQFNLAKDTHELIDTGKYMNICVGSYGDKAINKDCYIVIARNENNDPVICIEIDRELNKLEQVKLKYNNYPTGEIKETVEKWADLYKLDYSKTYDMNMDKLNKPKMRHEAY